MKPHLSVEFIRGLLFSYVAYHLYKLLSALGFNLWQSASLSYSPETPLWLIGGTLILNVLIYAGLAYALLFMPKGYERFVTIFLGVLVALHLFAVLFWSQFLPPGMPSPFNRVVIAQLVVGAAMVGVAFGYQRWLKRREASGSKTGPV